MAVPRILSTAIDLDDASASLDLAFEVAQYFGFDDEEAAATAVQIGRALGSWSTEAERIGLYRPYGLSLRTRQPAGLAADGFLN